MSSDRKTITVRCGVTCDKCGGCTGHTTDGERFHCNPACSCPESRCNCQCHEPGLLAHDSADCKIGGCEECLDYRQSPLQASCGMCGSSEPHGMVQDKCANQWSALEAERDALREVVDAVGRAIDLGEYVNPFIRAPYERWKASTDA